MEARSRSIEAWFTAIEQGQIKLPRFQRHEAWRPQQIAGLFENILRSPSLPVGVLLVLEVGDKELFHSRPIVGAPVLDVKPNMQLLDGQQRMTALWRALTDNYSEWKVFVRLLREDESDEENHDLKTSPVIEIEKRWDRKGVRQPVWADDPAEAIKRGLAPLSIFRPGAAGEKNFNDWRELLRRNNVYTDQLNDLASMLRTRVLTYTLPFLTLPAGTSRETALEVFINMNTSASLLRDYDIVVAQVEEGAGESLHLMVEDLIALMPSAKDYGRIEDILLSVAALLLDKPPLKKTYLEDNFGSSLSKVWPQVVAGMERGLQFLSDEAILHEKMLPSEVAVYLTCALWAVASNLKLDLEGNARIHIRKTLWRACWTDRYGKTATTRAYADFRVLKKLIRGESTETPELFDEKLNPLPDKEEIIRAGWPGRKERVPRAVLATSLRRKAYDFADGASVNRFNIASRELDHLYSVKHLEKERNNDLVNRALNCALISSPTNREKSADPPSIYIKKRAAASDLGEDIVRRRLATHLIPYDDLIADNYERFLESRAELIKNDMQALCKGEEPI